MNFVNATIIIDDKFLLLQIKNALSLYTKEIPLFTENQSAKSGSMHFATGVGKKMSLN